MLFLRRSNYIGSRPARFSPFVTRLLPSSPLSLSRYRFVFSLLVRLSYRRLISPLIVPFLEIACIARPNTLSIGTSLYPLSGLLSLLFNSPSLLFLEALLLRSSSFLKGLIEEVFTISYLYIALEFS